MLRGSAASYELCSDREEVLLMSIRTRDTKKALAECSFWFAQYHQNVGKSMILKCLSFFAMRSSSSRGYPRVMAL